MFDRSVLVMPAIHNNNLIQGSMTTMSGYAKAFRTVKKVNLKARGIMTEHIEDNEDNYDELEE